MCECCQNWIKLNGLFFNFKRNWWVQIRLQWIFPYNHHHGQMIFFSLSLLSTSLCVFLCVYRKKKNEYVKGGSKSKKKKPFGISKFRFHERYFVSRSVYFIYIYIYIVCCLCVYVFLFKMGRSKTKKNLICII